MQQGQKATDKAQFVTEFKAEKKTIRVERVENELGAFVLIRETAPGGRQDAVRVPLAGVPMLRTALAAVGGVED